VNSTYTVVGAATKVLLAGFSLSNSGIGETVVRSRGRFSFQSDQGGGREDQLGALGIIVVSDIAFAAGAAGIPGPVTEANDDGWMVWEGFSNAGNQTDGQDARIIEFDSKAARRIEEGFSLAIMVENAHATHGFEVTLALSQLAVVNT